MFSMQILKTNDAAAPLNVSPNTQRAWERRFGYPVPQRSAGRHRLYTRGEAVALRDAVRQGLSISAVVSRAREIDERRPSRVDEIVAAPVRNRDHERPEARA